MMRSLKNFFALVVLSGACLVTFGCSRTGSIYPVKGPLAAQVPVPSMNVTLRLHSRSTLQVLVRLANDETGSGVVPHYYAMHRPASDMAQAWDAVYGQGFYTREVLGVGEIAQGTVTCSKGTVLKLEIQRTLEGEAGKDTNPRVELRGVATDQNGNIFKLAL